MIYSPNSTSHTGTLFRTKLMLASPNSPRRSPKQFFTLVASNVKIGVSILIMIQRVNTLCSKLKVFNPVIKGVTISMMNYFFWIKFSTHKFLHDITVFKNVSTIYCNNLISFINTPLSSLFTFTNCWIFPSLPSAIVNLAPSPFPPVSPISRLITFIKSTFKAVSFGWQCFVKWIPVVFPSFVMHSAISPFKVAIVSSFIATNNTTNIHYSNCNRNGYKCQK